MRKIIIHYHTFKNAGSTVDRVLAACFPKGGWANFDGPTPDFFISQTELVHILGPRTHLSAMSSHQIRLPLPASMRFEVLPIVFIRRPELRAASIWRFERLHGADRARQAMAKQLSLADWIREQFSDRHGRHITNSQTYLFSFGYDFRPLRDPYETSVALRNLGEVPFVGLVEEFDISIRAYERLYGPQVPGFRIDRDVKAVNVTDKRPLSVAERLKELEAEIGPALFAEFQERNSKDIELYEWAQKRFEVEAAGIEVLPSLPSDRRGRIGALVARAKQAVVGNRDSDAVPSSVV
jgi:hypothetical protein